MPLTHFEAGLRIGGRSASELARTLSYCVVALALALAGWGVWSFVLAMIGSQALYAGVLWCGRGATMVLHLRARRTRVLLATSIPLGSIWLLAIAVTYADALILGSRFRTPWSAATCSPTSGRSSRRASCSSRSAAALYPALVQFGDRAGATVPRLPAGHQGAARASRCPPLFFLSSTPISRADSRRRALRRPGGPPRAARLRPARRSARPFRRRAAESRGIDDARGSARSSCSSRGWSAAASRSRSALGSPFGMAWANFFPAGSLVVLFVLSRGGDRRSSGGWRASWWRSTWCRWCRSRSRS